MKISFCILLISLFASGCEHYSSQHRRCNFQGINEIEDLKLTDRSIILDSVRFSNGLLYYQLIGELSSADSLHRYIITVDDNPFKTDDYQLVSAVFPIQLENQGLSCSLKHEQGKLAITWSNNESRIYVCDKVSEAR